MCERQMIRIYDLVHHRLIRQSGHVLTTPYHLDHGDRITVETSNGYERWEIKDVAL